MALIAGLGRRAGLGAGAAALIAVLVTRNVDLLLAAEHRFFKADGQVVAKIVAAHGAVLRLAGTAAKAAKPTAAKDALKNILKSSRAAGIRRIAAVVAARRSGIFMAKLVVACSALVIGKHLVCFVDLLERFLRRLIARVQIRVVFLRQTAVSALDLGIRRTALYAQHLVIIAFCQRCFLLTRKGMTQSFRAIPFFTVSSSYLSSCTS